MKGGQPPRGSVCLLFGCSGAMDRLVTKHINPLVLCWSDLHERRPRELVCPLVACCGTTYALHTSCLNAPFSHYKKEMFGYIKRG